MSDTDITRLVAHLLKKCSPLLAAIWGTLALVAAAATYGTQTVAEFRESIRDSMRTANEAKASVLDVHSDVKVLTATVFAHEKDIAVLKSQRGGGGK